MAQKKTLKKKLENVKMFNVNGGLFLGEKTVEDGVVKITNAYECNSSDLKEGILGWIKADNLGELVEQVSEGQYTITARTFTEKQLMELDIIIQQAEYAIKYAVSKVENSSLDTI